MRTRKARCVRRVAADTTLILPDAECAAAERPTEREACATIDCPIGWR